MKNCNKTTKKRKIKYYVDNRYHAECENTVGANISSAQCSDSLPTVREAGAWSLEIFLELLGMTIKSESLLSLLDARTGGLASAEDCRRSSVLGGESCRGLGFGESVFSVTQQQLIER